VKESLLISQIFKLWSIEKANKRLFWLVLITACNEMIYFCDVVLSLSNAVVNCQAVEENLLTADDLIESLKPMFYTRMRLGEFDPPELNPYSSIPMSVVLSAEHRELAVQAACMSFVLLKNSDNFLPIRRQFTRIAVCMSYILSYIVNDFCILLNFLLLNPLCRLNHDAASGL